MKPSYYDTDLTEPDTLPLPVEILETDIDLYYHMAFSLYRLIEENNSKGKSTLVILPVGPVFQYRRFVWLMRERPLNLQNLTCFFMDEYLDTSGSWIPEDSPLSFRGFIQRELISPLQDRTLPPESRLSPEQVRFPDPFRLKEFDQCYEDCGGAEVCYGGIGITGHLAFNEPPDSSESISAEEFCRLPSRIVELTPQTIAINSNTALRGAIDLIPKKAVTIGFKQILQSKKIRIYCNRPWQSAVVRRALFDTPSPSFPVTLVRTHPDVRIWVTREVAEKPAFGLR